MKETVLSLFINKQTPKEIAAALGISVEEVIEQLRIDYIICSKRSIEKTLIFRDAVIHYIDNGRKSATKSAKEFGLPPSDFCKYLKALGLQAINNQNRTKFNAEIFDTIDTEEKAYWLGFIFADGGISKIPEPGKKVHYQFELSLASVDVEHLHKFNKFMEHESNNVKLGKVKLNGKVFERCRWIINNKHLWNQLNNLGCTPQKSLTLKFPNIPDHLRRHFIRGYFDGDGSLGIYKTDYNPKIMCSCLGTEDVLNGILRDTDLPRHFRNKKEHAEETLSFEFVSEKCMRFLNYIYKDSTIYLERKYNKYLDICRLWEKSHRLSGSKIGESCDANPEVT